MRALAGVLETGEVATEAPSAARPHRKPGLGRLQSRRRWSATACSTYVASLCDALPCPPPPPLHSALARQLLPSHPSQTGCASTFARSVRPRPRRPALFSFFFVPRAPLPPLSLSAPLPCRACLLAQWPLLLPLLWALQRHPYRPPRLAGRVAGLPRRGTASGGERTPSVAHPSPLPCLLVVLLLLLPLPRPPPLPLLVLVHPPSPSRFGWLPQRAPPRAPRRQSTRTPRRGRRWSGRYRGWR